MRLALEPQLEAFTEKIIGDATRWPAFQLLQTHSGNWARSARL